ncbi:Uncharacterized protein dnl_62610 [Desulfonema limicola]|uniref:Uncharacterized protein n=1 Tax=Desulfonema limicola TaxID=45656 RepID=A0A975BE44_9BACT|nr:hypothetical protein [Desulfonema limicola]QTA83842.1 Uncharacterized protein dnl_62610 [Desulfonema limicola]
MTEYIKTEDDRKGYQWPASALTVNEMAILNNWRKQTKTPINELLRQAVVILDDIIKKNGDKNGNKKSVQ